jgi:hypothetical protein
MNNVVIYFVGLIAHITIAATATQPARQIATLVADANHQPAILVDTIAVLPSFNPFPSVVVPDTGRTLFTISGVITIAGVTTGAATTQSNDFARDVISLVTASGGGNPSLATDVINETTGNAASAYIDLSGGTLDVAGYYSLMGKHNVIGTVCVPSATLYSTTGTSPYIEFVSTKGYHLRVRTGSTIYVTNFPDMAGNGHFKSYANVIDQSSGAVNVGFWINGAACTTKYPIFDTKSIGAKGADIECTNSHFP